MIFKTFDSNIDKVSSKWGIFGKSFNDIGMAIVGRVNDIKKNFQATDDLRASIKNSDSIWKRLYPDKDSIKSQFIDVNAQYPKIDENNFDFDGWIKDLNEIDKAVKNGIISWQDYSNRLDEDQKWIAKWGQETEGQIRTQSDMVKANQKARASAIAHNEALKQQTLGAKASKVALQALSTVGNMLAMWAISEVISGITAIAQSAEKTAEKAKELGSEFSSTKSDIEGYKTKISELHETINDNTSSIYEVTEARRSLLRIQDEMIEKYGSEKGAISDITTAINGQADALDNLVQKEWLKTKNQFNDVDFWGGTSNFLSGYADEMERMNDVMNGNAEQGFFGKAFSEFFNPETYIRNNPVAAYVEFLVDSTKESMESGGKTVGGSFTAFIDYIKKRIGETKNSINKANYKGIQVNIGGLPSEKNAKYADLRQTLENAGYKDNIINGELVLQGDNLKDVYKQILRLQEVVDDLDVPKEFARDLSEQAKDIQKNLSDYNAIFDQQVLTEEVLPNEELSKAWKDAQKSYSEYETALISGDEDAINAKSEELAAIFNQIAETGNQNVIDLFNDLFPDLQSIAGQWNFEVNLKADGGALEKDIKNELDKLDGSEDGNIGLSSEDILNFDWKTASEEKGKAYQKLEEIAKKQGFDDVKQLVPLLEKQGLIRSRQYNELAKKIGKENADSLSPEDLEIAYTIKGDFSSFDELNAKIEEHKKELASVPNRLKNLWNSDDFSDAKKSLAELAKESKITAADIESLAKENKALASFLEESGISAQFAAECFNKLCNGENDFSFITDGVLALDKALNGMEESMEKASKAKSEYDKAMSQDDYNKDFKNYQEAYAAAMEMFEKGEYGRNFRSTMDYLLGEDSYTMSIEEMYDSIKQLENIFGEDSTNGLEFLDKLYGMREILDGTQSSLEKLSDGSYKFNFSTDDFDTIAEHMGMTTDEVTACVSALGMFGDTQLYNINEVRDAIKELEMSYKDGETTILSMQSLIRTLSDMGRSDWEIQEILDDIKDMDDIQLLDFNTDDLESLMSQLEELALVKIDVDADENKRINVDSLISNLKETFQMSYDEIGAFVDKLEGSFTFSNAEGNTLTLNEIHDKLDTLKADAENPTNAVENSTKAVNDATKAMIALTNAIKQIPSSASSSKPASALAALVSIGNTQASGSANASGSIGIKQDETALINELGHETIIDPDKGTYEIVEGGAQFRKLKKGQIVLNHLQTKALQKYGKISSFGKMFFGGNAKLKRNSHVLSSMDFGAARGTTSSNNPSTNNTRNTGTNEASSDQSGTSTSDNTKNDYSKTFNWIETALHNVEQAVSRLKDKVSRAYESWSKRNNNLRAELSEIQNEITMQQKAYEQYMAKAESVGLPDFYKHMVQGGALSIEDITDENLAEKISDYQDWYEKALACRDAIDDLTNSVSSLYKTDFDNTASQFDSFLSVIEHRRSMLDKAISQTEEKGLLVSAEYYKALIRTEEENLAQLAQKKNALLLSLNNTVANGAIEEYSQDWYDMRGQIDDVTQAIEEANTAMIQYGNSIRDIKWETFDLLQERISGITSESDFLLNLLENKTLYDKNNGQLTNEGMAAMGLHGLNYDIYMAQSEKYAQDELEETEYEKYIADQKQLLDDLYLEYELVLNQRLDNLDALLENMIDRINANASTIKSTLSDTASNVGSSLSGSMRGIWDTSTTTITQVLAAYGENILTSNNKVNSTLSSMNQNLQNMITQLNTLAETKIQSVAASAATVSSPVVGSIYFLI